MVTGLRAGGGIGDILTVPINIVNGTSLDTWQYLGLRAIFDLLFFIMIRFDFGEGDGHGAVTSMATGMVDGDG